MKRRFIQAALAGAVCLLAAAWSVAAKSRLVEDVPGAGRIDWQKGAIYATGMGAMPKQEANRAKAYLKARGYAKMEALANLLMVVDKVRIDAESYGEDYEAQSEKIRMEIKGILKGAQITGERKIKIEGDWVVEVTVATQMYGDEGLANIVIPEAIRRDRMEEEEEIAPPAPKVVIPPKPVPPPAPLPKDQDGPYTSAIIDTRGYGVLPCMSPKIRRPNGSEVWGTVKVDPNYVIEHGIVVYARNLDEARRNKRAGDNPLILRAIGRAGTSSLADPVLSNED
ncbi:MAG: hypothetical protein IT210_06075, partial [Armatimonadetes bacterium]|nr:hypothetical protein [Armatimonadota bacterium]